jgi:hypothetical protein
MLSMGARHARAKYREQELGSKEKWNASGELHFQRTMLLCVNAPSVHSEERGLGIGSRPTTGAPVETAFTSADLQFLIKPMEARFAARRPNLVMNKPGDPPAAVGADDKVPPGQMSIPQPVTVDVKGTMTVDDYKACAMCMAVCQNMVQKTLTDAAKIAGVEPEVALKNMNAWLKAYLNFPFPFFNFKDTQRNEVKKASFSLKADPDVVESIVNIKGMDGLKDAVVGALKKAGGNLASYQNSDQAFNYFGIITAYNETEIAVRVIKFAMNMKTTDASSLCVTYSSTSLDSLYDTYQFTAEKDLMIKLQQKMGDQMVDYMANKLLEFIKSFYDHELVAFQTDLASMLKLAK